MTYFTNHIKQRIARKFKTIFEHPSQKTLKEKDGLFATSLT
jgi:hypothetical protein